MCGIAGWVSFDRELRDEGAVLDAMTETMECRGPDDRGAWAEGPAGLGHRRLAIIDLPGGRQPMTFPTAHGTVAMVYSGEAYNFTELRRELEARGHRFTTDSDTEVVLHGYLEWGDEVAERLNGMYAFAVWDGRRSKLVMIRDRMGIKPFYYYPTPDGVLFGSEPKAILANPLARRRVTLDGMRELLTMVKTPGHAVWDGMAEVEPGTVVTVDREGLHRRVYWELETKEHTDDKATTIATVRELLDDIVRRQLVADVPRCTLLSGGLDSSAMTALAARQLGEHGEKVRSFAVDFVGQTDHFIADDLRGTPDTPFVHDVARTAHTEHQDIVLDPQSLADPEVRAKGIRARDLPAGFGDMDASLYLLFKAIRRESTVALSGESADEVFGGYLQFFDEEARKGTTFPWLAGFGRHFGQDAETLDPALLTALDLDGYVADSHRGAVKDIQRLDGESDFEYGMRRMSHLHLTRFVRILLDRKDRASMAVGLEVRVPFCDHRLVEYAYNTPWSLKSFDGREKSLLREATADLLPKSVYDRVKSPYPSTQDPAYATALRAQAKDLLTNPSHPVFDLVDRTHLHEIAHRTTQVNSQAGRRGLERALDLALWLEMYRPELSLN
ncbi:asparagine synthase (glutamine-hydrolyzing) [Streptomyces acidiscabies]|uniref:asparagine synthase (glutamine-hydrolyzing) n=1 Tax=Streptomyces acidiscabies TaxID=42234 RepID=A0AAP6BDV9_9ACTN|nr:asparagine synthase (glutamine-hydrolyzing) [Streptomyces acidiscabies]MBP5941745.1 asparagine synthase (glutamine-hydrolyzing) [Streptomyces sp. LBUM 1476]MBZ3913163.1 asparagine synthase (glutamine-hydrolyzing) [Streptomyces acidiscabies]MDX2962858.1 asparagine synthase (glutamine-hydrolyzing) [Streptomyces acidiscabies]MDX3021369.1 asparagine synthase (glutamine-hydrolyzing) [Streptomyces acidiscabies]MDX3790127.1 asparagine synthase (glutamine-hydrolyzing) [Streptomyces acidiscabies]